jgi:cell division protein FtsZ
MAEIKPSIETLAKIKVVGAGGAGGATINQMVRQKIRGVEFLAVNSDAQALHHSLATVKLHIGKETTRGLGAGMDPDVGRKAAEENQNDIRDALKGADMVFVTCGLGGGTGTGSSPLVAEIARDSGALTVAVVTRPFAFEGSQRLSIAERGLKELAEKVDTIIVIPNDRVLEIVDKKVTMMDAFRVVDDVLAQGVQGIAELITVPGLTNVDFADVKSIMRDAGSALMGIGVAAGENRAAEAAKAAITNPLVEVTIDGARGILFNITAGPDFRMHELQEAANVIVAQADQNPKVIYGTVIDENMKDDVRVTVIATGFGVEKQGAGAGGAISESGGGYRPSLFTRKASQSQAPEAPMNDKRDMRAPAEEEEQENDEEDELDIPAFIRKKMS